MPPNNDLGTAGLILRNCKAKSPIMLAMDQVRALLRRPAIARGIKGATGLLLIGVGARLATLRSPAP
jgi:threonine/homoserine/homoserine lactone efflux protein